jgi:hypothetical protein
MLLFFSFKTIIYLDYWKKDSAKKSGNDYESGDSQVKEKFIIKDPGDCKNSSSYGYNKGQPCVLVKMNKVK